MQIKKETPPVYDQILASECDFNPNLTIFTYGDAIYNPAGVEIPDHLIVHEETHSKQQGDAPGAWWERYLRDQYFRTTQEVEAYANQFRFIAKFQKDRNVRARILLDMASILASKMYGSVISTQSAMKMIKEKACVK